MTIKIAHIADTHLGHRQYGLREREEDFYESFNNIIDDIIDKNVDYVLHSGDLFEHSKPPIKALLVAQKAFLKLMQHQIQVYTIAGNHDILQKRNTTIPQELYKNDNFHIIKTKENTFKINENIVLCGLPYYSKSSEASVKERLIEITEKVKDYKWKILMLHGGISKYVDKYEAEFELDTIPEGYDYYAMGHLHGRILDNFKNGKLSYPGSTEIRKIDELSNYWKNSKGYTLVTIDDDKLDAEFINFELTRKFIKKEINYPEIDEKLDKLEKKINTIIEENNKKPLVYLTIKNGNFERSEVIEKIDDKLGDITLDLQIICNPNDTTMDILDISGENSLTPEHIIRERIMEEFMDEKIATLGLELYKNLSIHNINEAHEISKDFFNERYHE